jgi:general secretion pathway protein J
MRRRTAAGFTLLELILALSIVGALLAISFGGLRVGLTAWRRGEDRAEAHQHARTLLDLLARSLSGAHAYRLPTGEGRQLTLLFEGEPGRIAFVTVSPPFPADSAIAFTAVTFSVEGGTPGLAVRQKALPNLDPFELLLPVLVDPAVDGIGFLYQRETGEWVDRWDAALERALPRAVEVTLSTALNGRSLDTPPFVVPLRATRP